MGDRPPLEPRGAVDRWIVRHWLSTSVIFGLVAGVLVGAMRSSLFYGFLMGIGVVIVCGAVLSIVVSRVR